VEQLQTLMFASASEDKQELILSRFHSALLLSSSHASVVSLYLLYLSSLLLSSSSFSLHRLRELYRANVMLNAASCLALIQWEQQWAEIQEEGRGGQGADDGVRCVRELWERVVRERGDDLEAWQNWVRQERERNDVEFVNVLLHRAHRQLGEEKSRKL